MIVILIKVSFYLVLSRDWRGNVLNFFFFFFTLPSCEKLNFFKCEKNSGWGGIFIILEKRNIPNQKWDKKEKKNNVI